jgi:hypothetical protein
VDGVARVDPAKYNHRTSADSQPRRPRLVLIPQAVELPPIDPPLRNPPPNACPCAQAFCIRKKFGIRSVAARAH